MGTPEMAGAPRPEASQPGASHIGTTRVSEAFFQAQARNRRATWRMSALCLFAALLMGIPLTLVLTPFLYAVAMVIAEVVNQFSSLPPAFWQYTGDLTKLAYRVADALINQHGTVGPQDLAISLALLLGPGIVFALVLWTGVLLLFRHGGVGGTIAALNAREPNKADLKELQLADAVQEMAIAAGLPAPKVMLLDSPGANCAAIGTSPADAHIVVSRRALDDLGRDELQALIGHLVASVGNGDLHIAFTVTSVFETCGLIVALINAPFGRQARATLWRVLRYAFRRGPASAADCDEVAELLADTMDVSSTDIDCFFNSSRPGLIRKVLRVALFPLQFTNMAIELTLWFFLNVLLGPCMALVWRTRRYLADAGAVELTRNPDALANALQHLSADSTAVGAGGWATHLFVVNPGGDRSLGDGAGVQQHKVLEAWQAASTHVSAENRVANLGRQSGTASPVPIQANVADYARFRKEIMTTVLAASAGDAAAAGRVQAFAQAMGGASAFGLSALPNFQDVALAQKGDRAAIARLRMLRQTSHEQPRRGRTGLQTHSFVSFHPPLKKRAARLAKMGAHLIASKRHRSSVAAVLFAVLYAIMIPLMIAAGLMMLFVIALMIGLNLMFLALWLTVIHWAFAQDWAQNLQGVENFVNDVATAISKSR